MASTRTLIGTMACLCCTRSIPVRESENGTLNAACGWCEFPAWAKKDTEAARIIRARIKPDPAAAASPVAAPKPAPAAPAAAPTPAPTPAPAPARSASPFHNL